MLEVSDNAKSLLKEMLEERSDPSHVFRLSKEGESFGLRLDAPAEDDTVFEQEGTDVLAVAADVADGLEGITIDREDTPEGPRLVLLQ